ncbi:hypothetical protein J3L18_23700 [Mucilaginibacter gossypii]|uniref:hypothetical protein n=1 Tax=Mucilaginibacter gossypii TaxID=551996 RepID=UPI000DCCD47C|nr:MULTISPECIES: hypothetical protein [Mucilaginibacter]QTE36110.1 hypothetical protein J3L18_23700 [Mucilaginibacter gossypii]RAV59976.1 hypothetical protein DIU36_03110 [Mucilaginibacter rubeus]
MEKIKKLHLEKLNRAQTRLLDFEEISYNGALIEIPIKELVRPNYSSRLLVDNQQKAIATSLSRFGFLGGIFIEGRSNHVIDGWHRAEQWRKMGQKLIPCYKVVCTPEQERSLHLSLNQQSATWNPETFGIEFKDFNLEDDFGIRPDDLRLESKPFTSKFNDRPNETTSDFIKFSTTIPAELYDRLKLIRKQMQAPSIAAAVTNLIKFYDESY